MMTRLLLCMLLPLMTCDNSGASGVPGMPGMPGAPGMPGDPDRSGSRLQPIYNRWVAEDGTQVTSWSNQYHDTKLDTDCYFALAEDNVVRCIPVDPPDSRGGSFQVGY